MKNHKWAILLAVVTAIIIFYPQIFLRYDLQDAYQGIELIGASDDEANWLPRIREVQDGHPTFSSAYYKDGKDEPYLLQPLGTMMVGYLGKAFSLNLNDTVLLFRFVFPFLVFLILYSFVYFFTKEKLVALATSTFFCLGKTLFARTAIFEVLAGQNPKNNFLNLARPVNPALTWFFFFGFLLSFWLFLERKQWRYGILSAIILGLSFYDYFYTWTFLYVFCGILGIIYLFKKRWLDIKRIAIVLLLAGIIAIPYLINLYQTTLHPNYAELGQRYGLLDGRTPTIGLLVPLLFVVFLLFFSRKKKEHFFFALALVITPFIVNNQQLITSKALSNVHYHWYFHIPLAVVLLIIMLFSQISERKEKLFKNKEFLKKTLAILIIVISIAMGIFIQTNSYTVNKPEIIERQQYGPVMDWLNENAEKEEVVFANSNVSDFIIIYTPLNIFYNASIGKALVASQDRLLNTLFLIYRLEGVSEEGAEEFFFENKKRLSHFMYGMYYMFTTGHFTGMPNEILVGWIQRYRDTFKISTPDFIADTFDKYEVNYVVWDKSKEPAWKLDQYLFLEKAAEIDNFIIYRYVNF